MEGVLFNYFVDFRWF